MTKLEEDYKNIQLNILRQTEISSIKTEKFIDIFDAILNYRLVISVNFCSYIIYDITYRCI